MFRAGGRLELVKCARARARARVFHFDASFVAHVPPPLNVAVAAAESGIGGAHAARLPTKVKTPRRGASSSDGQKHAARARVRTRVFSCDLIDECRRLPSFSVTSLALNTIIGMLQLTQRCSFRVGGRLAACVQKKTLGVALLVGTKIAGLTAFVALD